MDVHSALDRFMRTPDLFEAKQFLTEQQHVLLSDEGIDYVRRQMARAESGSDLATALTLKGRAILQAREMSIGYAVASLFLALNPDPVSEPVAEKLAGVSSPEEIQALAAEDEKRAVEIRHVAAAMRLQGDLQAELDAGRYPLGDSRRTQACRALAELCDVRIHPETWAKFAAQFAEAMASEMGAPPTVIGECIELYEAVLSVAPSRKDLAANAHHGIGLMYARRASAGDPGALDRAREHFAAALTLESELGDSQEQARTLIALAQTLLSDATADATTIRTAIEYLTGAIGLIAEEPDAAPELLTAQQTLEEAYRRLATYAPRGNETVIPSFPDYATELSHRALSPGFMAEEWLTPDESPALWQEVLGVERLDTAAGMPFAGLMAIRRHGIGSRLTNGTLSWDVHRETPNDVLYGWRVTNDIGVEDQESLVRAIRGESALVVVTLRVRRHLRDEDRSIWQSRLDSLELETTEVPSPAVTSPSQQEIEQRMRSLSSPPETAIADPQTLCSTMLEGISRRRAPEIYAGMLALCGSHVMAQAEVDADTLRTVISMLRRAVETAAPRSEVWARAMVTLAKALRQQAALAEEPEIGVPATAFRAAMSAFANLNAQADFAATVYELGNTLRLTSASPEDLRNALRLYVEALKYQPQDQDPIGWAESTIALGDVFAELHAKTHDAEAREQAKAAYERVLTASAPEDGAAKGSDAMTAATTRASAGLRALGGQM